MEAKPGAMYKRLGVRYTVEEVRDDAVVLSTRSPLGNSGEVTRRRFREEVESGRAVLHPECGTCGFAFDPEGLEDGLCRQCRFHGAGVPVRCKMAAGEPGMRASMAERALRSGDPRGYLLDLIGDPARTFHDRLDAEELLSGAVPVSELLEASVRCPNCRNGEQYTMDPHTGAVHCHCGEQMKPPDEAEA